MANTYTGTSTISNQTGITGVIKTAYDRYIEFALRSQPLLRSIADRRPVQQAHPGTSVVFQNYVDLSAATTALTENVDPDSVALSDTTNVTVTLNEYGNVVLETRKLAELALSDVDPAIANIVAYNMADSLDQIVQTELRGGTNVRLPAGRAGTANITGTDVMLGNQLRFATTKLKGFNAIPRWQTLYGAYIHPDVTYDLKAESGSGAFEDIRKYTDANVGNILHSVAGIIHGAYVVESPRMYNATDGASSARVFRSLVVGQQALAEAVAIEPGIVIGPVTDKLMRARPVGWYGLLGWKRYRENALYRIESTSSINNA